MVEMLKNYAHFLIQQTCFQCPLYYARHWRGTGNKAKVLHALVAPSGRELQCGEAT